MCGTLKLPDEATTVYPHSISKHLVTYTERDANPSHMLSRNKEVPSYLRKRHIGGDTTMYTYTKLETLS